MQSEKLHTKTSGILCFHYTGKVIKNINDCSGRGEEELGRNWSLLATDIGFFSYSLLFLSLSPFFYAFFLEMVIPYCSGWSGTFNNPASAT